MGSIQNPNRSSLFDDYKMGLENALQRNCADDAVSYSNALDVVHRREIPPTFNLKFRRYPVPPQAFLLANKDVVSLGLENLHRVGCCNLCYFGCVILSQSKVLLKSIRTTESNTNDDDATSDILGRCLPAAGIDRAIFLSSALVFVESPPSFQNEFVWAIFLRDSNFIVTKHGHLFLRSTGQLVSTPK